MKIRIGFLMFFRSPRSDKAHEALPTYSGLLREEGRVAMLPALIWEQKFQTKCSVVVYLYVEQIIVWIVVHLPVLVVSLFIDIGN